MYDQDIIEKKASSPMATSLLAISAACLLGAMIFAGMHTKEYVYGQEKAVDSAAAWTKKESRQAQNLAKEIFADEEG